MRNILADRPEATFVSFQEIVKLSGNCQMATSAKNLSSSSYTVVIWDNIFARECLSRCLRYADADADVACFASVEEWTSTDEPSECVVLLCVTNRRATELAVRRDIPAIKTWCAAVLPIIVSNVEHVDQMVEAIDGGAKGYIPMSSSLDVTLEATRLVRAGGTFVPARALMVSSGRSLESSPQQGPFTVRQMEVLRAIRLGKPNKIIAHELDMSECTVKVHVRNIMKILRAKNRTEVAYLTNSLFSDDDLTTDRNDGLDREC